MTLKEKVERQVMGGIELMLDEAMEETRPGPKQNTSWNRNRWKKGNTGLTPEEYAEQLERRHAHAKRH